MCCPHNPINFGLLATILLTGLSACGGGSSDSGEGYFKIYNASTNAPDIYLTIEDSDEIEKRYSGIGYGESAGYYSYSPDTYSVELAWQDGDNSYDAIVYQDNLKVSDEEVQLVVVTGDINQPNVLTFQYQDEDPDDDEDQFTLRFLNVHQSAEAVDVYMSKEDETFNEAVLVGAYSYGELSPSHYFDIDNYKFYLTSAGSTEVLYESEEIAYSYTTQYIMVIRENIGPGDSPFTLDKLSKSTSTVTYPDEDSGAEYRVYNGLIPHELMPSYSGFFDLYIDSIDDSPEVAALAQGEFSESISMPFGDYSLDLTNAGESSAFAKNHLLSLSPNSDKTVFFYTTEETEDDDGDDNIEEETTLYVNHLVTDNNNQISLYNHQVKIINLIQDDDFGGVTVAFVRSNETIDTAANSLYNTRLTPMSVSLLNNTYDVYIVAEVDDSDLILAATQITLSEDSGNLFLVLEQDPVSSTGYKLTFAAQSE